MMKNDELFGDLADLLYSQGRPITIPVVVSRHKWVAELTLSTRDDGFELLAIFASPNGRRYSFYLTDMTTDVEVYSRNGRLIMTQFPSNSIPSWICDRIDFLRDVLSDF